MCKKPAAGQNFAAMAKKNRFFVFFGAWGGRRPKLNIPTGFQPAQ
jgi:hypothetical protein